MRDIPAIQATNTLWMLWAVASSLAWLLPSHDAPWTTFYQEALAVAVVIPIFCWALYVGLVRWQIGSLAAGFVVAALIPLLQAAFGLFVTPSEAALVSAYLLGFALTLSAAHQAETRRPGVLIEHLFTALLIAALASTALALCQWLHIDALGILLAPEFGDNRAIANVGQPNNLATLLVWGLVAVWWKHYRGMLGGGTAGIAAAFLLVGIVLTGSRAGDLQVVLLGIAAIAGRRLLHTREHRLGGSVLALWFVTCILALAPVTRFLSGAETRPLLDGASPQERTVLLALDVAAIAHRPWFGWGWNQNVTAHVALAREFPMHGTVGNAHNLLLDLLIWNGIPLGLLLFAGLCAWGWRSARRFKDGESALLLIATATFAVHAMLELPYVFACFLIPLAIVLGTLGARVSPSPLFELPRAVIALGVLAFAVFIGLAFNEYGRIVANSTAARMVDARIAGAKPPVDPEAFVLKSLAGRLQQLQTHPTPGMTSAALNEMRLAVTRYPSTPGLFRYAQSAALNDQPDNAAWALQVLCSLHVASDCTAAKDSWQQLIKEGETPLAKVRFP